MEFLPDDMAIADRRRHSQALTRPELAVLLAYAKLSLNHHLQASQVPDDPYLARELSRYFPDAIEERFPDAIARHRLRREIISTQLANSMINRGGPSLVVRIADQTGAAAADIALAFAAVHDSYGMGELDDAIDKLDNQVSGKLQLDLYMAVEELLLDRLVWFLRNVDLTKGLATIVEHYRVGIAAVEAALDDALSEDAAQARRHREAELKKEGVPDDLARRIANLPALASATDIVAVAERTGRKVADMTATYFAAESFFRLDRIANAARGIVISDYFDRLALDRALEFDRRCGAPAHRGDGGRRPRGRACRRGLGRTAQERGPSHPHFRAGDRQLRIDAVEAVGGGEFAGRFGEAVARKRFRPNRLRPHPLAAMLRDATCGRSSA